MKRITREEAAREFHGRGPGERVLPPPPANGAYHWPDRLAAELVRNLGASERAYHLIVTLTPRLCPAPAPEAP